jgi:hypothetical protein
MACRLSSVGYAGDIEPNATPRRFVGAKASVVTLELTPEQLEIGDAVRRFASTRAAQQGLVCAVYHRAMG